MLIILEAFSTSAHGDHGNCAYDSSSFNSVITLPVCLLIILEAFSDPGAARPSQSTRPTAYNNSDCPRGRRQMKRECDPAHGYAIMTRTEVEIAAY